MLHPLVLPLSPPSHAESPYNEKDYCKNDDTGDGASCSDSYAGTLCRRWQSRIGHADPVPTLVAILWDVHTYLAIGTSRTIRGLWRTCDASFEDGSECALNFCERHMLVLIIRLQTRSNSCDTLLFTYHMTCLSFLV
jgi:hypothetical protein